MAEHVEAIVPNFYIRVKHTEPNDFIRLPNNVSRAIDGAYARIATFRTRGGAWKVWITKAGQGRPMRFANGWRQFVQRNDVRDGVLLTFNHSQNLDFHVQIFGRDGTEFHQPPYCTCALHIQPSEIPHQHRLYATTDIKGWGTMFRYPNTPLSRVALPDWVADLPRFGERQCLSLVDGEGMSWPVSITREIQSDNKVNVYLSEGWHQFYDGHRLGVGDIVSFYIQGHCSRDDTSTIRVKIRRFLWQDGKRVVVDS
ncbi:B3 domain-containing protein REM9-like [Salvia miltiorrhiza]|uniref:B3 domain-containing protein REM9-like n=1 Tax=Salvia miltiorrhiza TaxID=226208 RepID=UPI0025AD0D08|nr:B3 domain-containing protein REM9-like [Salvia miltiorrhiza]